MAGRCFKRNDNVDRGRVLHFFQKSVRPNPFRFVDMPSQVGVSVLRDITLINDSYDVEGTGAVDLRQLATKHMGIAVGSRSLEKLSATLLRRRLSKGSVRMSNWEQQLSDEQVRITTVPPQGTRHYFSFAADAPFFFRLLHARHMLQP